MGYSETLVWGFLVERSHSFLSLSKPIPWTATIIIVKLHLSSIRLVNVSLFLYFSLIG